MIIYQLVGVASNATTGNGFIEKWRTELTSLTRRSSSLAGVTSPSSTVVDLFGMLRIFGLSGECDLE